MFLADRAKGERTEPNSCPKETKKKGGCCGPASEARSGGKSAGHWVFFIRVKAKRDHRGPVLLMVSECE